MTTTIEVTPQLAKALLAERAEHRVVMSTPFADPDYHWLVGVHEDRVREVSWAAIDCFAAMTDDELAEIAKSKETP